LQLAEIVNVRHKTNIRQTLKNYAIKTNHQASKIEIHATASPNIDKHERRNIIIYRNLWEKLFSKPLINYNIMMPQFIDIANEFNVLSG